MLIETLKSLFNRDLNRLRLEIELYKNDENIWKVEMPQLFYTEVEIKAINSKQNLTLTEAAFVLNVSPLTLSRCTLEGKMNAVKVGECKINCVS